MLHIILSHHGLAERRGARGLSAVADVVAYDLLWHRVRIEVEDPEARRFLGVLDHGAVQEDIRPEVEVHIGVTGSPGDYHLSENGDDWRRLDTPTDVLNIVHSRVQSRALELASRKGWVCLHGFTAVVGGRRVVVIGPSGAGKTTTALGLLAAGARVDGDECVLVAGGQVVAVPRRFLVKSGTAALVPERPRGWRRRSTSATGSRRCRSSIPGSAAVAGGPASTASTTSCSWNDTTGSTELTAADGSGDPGSAARPDVARGGAAVPDRQGAQRRHRRCPSAGTSGSARRPTRRAGWGCFH